MMATVRPPIGRADAMPELDRALDMVSLGWLNDNHPALATAIEETLAHGHYPLDVRRRVMAVTDRPELARRCEQAARAMARTIETAIP